MIRHELVGSLGAYFGRQHSSSCIAFSQHSSSVTCLPHSSVKCCFQLGRLKMFKGSLERSYCARSNSWNSGLPYSFGLRKQANVLKLFRSCTILEIATRPWLLRSRVCSVSIDRHHRAVFLVVHSLTARRDLSQRMKFLGELTTDALAFNSARTGWALQHLVSLTEF